MHTTLFKCHNAKSPNQIETGILRNASARNLSLGKAALPTALGKNHIQSAEQGGYDRRIHYGINCASSSCPAISPQVFTSHNVDELLTSLEKESAEKPLVKRTDENGHKIEILHTYTMIKQLAILGFLASEVVAKTAFNYLPIPGKFEKCVEVIDTTKPMYYRSAPYG